MSLQCTKNAVKAVRIKILMILLIINTFSDKVAIITPICLKVSELNNHFLIKI